MNTTVNHIATVTLTAVGYPGVAISAMMNGDIPRVINGGAKWSPLQIPRGRDTLEFTSEDPVKLSFGIMLDAWPDGNVEGTCRQLYGWWAKNALPDQPSIVHVSGPVPYPELDYVITKIDDSGEVQRNRNGLRCRQELKFEWTEYRPPNLITVNAPAAAPAAAAVAAAPAPVVPVAVEIVRNATNRTYTVRKNDTLSAIAARLLGNANRWHDIANLNGIRDPKKLRIGTLLRIPT